MRLNWIVRSRGQIWWQRRKVSTEFRSAIDLAGKVLGPALDQVNLVALLRNDQNLSGLACKSGLNLNHPLVATIR